MLCDDLETRGLMEVKFFKERMEKRMFSRVVKCSLDYCLNCVFMTEAICNLRWLYVGTVVLSSSGG